MDDMDSMDDMDTMDSNAPSFLLAFISGLKLHGPLFLAMKPSSAMYDDAWNRAAFL